MKHKCHYLSANLTIIIGLLVILIVGLVFLLNRTELATTRPKLIIDEDGGADDAMAIFIALLNEKYFEGPDVVALTTVNGNVKEGQVFENTQRILDIAQRRDVPIYRGCESALVEGHATDQYFGQDGLGDNDTVIFKTTPAETEPAALALVELTKKYEGQITVVAMGPLTNIALAIKLDSNFTSRLSHLYVGAGNIHSYIHNEPEFNALLDVEAYRIVVTECDPEKLIIVPFSQIKNDLLISNEWRKNVLGSIKTEIMEAQNVFERVSLPSSPLWQLLDPALMTVALKYPYFVTETRYSNNSIHLCGEKRGINTNVFTTVPNATARMVYAVDQQYFMKFLLDVFSAELN